MKPPKKKKQKKYVKLSTKIISDSLENYRWKPPPKEEDSGYRDRAKERREGDNPDYKGVQAELTTGFQSVPPPDVYVA